MVADATQNAGERGLGIAVVELRRFGQGIEGGRPLTPKGRCGVGWNGRAGSLWVRQVNRLSDDIGWEPDVVGRILVCWRPGDAGPVELMHVLESRLD